ncbi:MarR family transcriptional regulator [Rhizobium sp. ZPR3]|uniref:MarR family transcriptional regulator n=2 Tax=unclassified Rhizobium TaxID=2613769 RepID=A0AAU7SR92_9HYPH
MHDIFERKEKFLRVGTALQKMARKIEEAFAQTAREQHLHPTDLSCIALLLLDPRPISPTEINSYLGLTSGSGTALLDRLEKAGYIRRAPNPRDRRGVCITLNEEAAREPINHLRKLQTQYYHVTDRFSNEELDTIHAYLEGIANLAFKVDKIDDDRRA